MNSKQASKFIDLAERIERADYIVLDSQRLLSGEEQRMIVKAVRSHEMLMKEMEAQRDYWAGKAADVAAGLQEGEKLTAIMADRIAHYSEAADHINGVLALVGSPKQP